MNDDGANALFNMPLLAVILQGDVHPEGLRRWFHRRDGRGVAFYSYFSWFKEDSRISVENEMSFGSSVAADLFLPVFIIALSWWLSACLPPTNTR
ncbi:MAG: hypothetical protein R3F11_30255 [Verrucomicrobiales bacterium]